MSTDDCAVRSSVESLTSVYVGPPYGRDEEVPTGLKLLLALIDGSHWPLQVEGDTGVGKEAGFGFNQAPVCPGGQRETALDPGPVPDGIFPEFPYVYPGIGVTAYACQMNCNYVITGTLGAHVIVGKIDGQWHILRVLDSGQTQPIFGPSNACRCCGDALKDKKLRARVLHVSSSGGDYRACDEFRLDPLSTERGYNPMQITLSCGSTAESVLEDITDWSARAFGSAAEITSLFCCTAFEDNCTRVVSGYGEDCNCNSDETSGSGAADCRFEATIEFTHLGIDYVVLIYQEILDAEDDPCTEFADVFIENVIAEAAGLPDLQPDDRVIMARIPGGLAGRTALDGTDPIEWFIIRACNVADCANPCDEPPGYTSPCCGKLCNELPTSLSATIEVIDSACVCTSGSTLSATLVRDATDPAGTCEGAVNIIWVVNPTADTTPTEISGCINDPGGVPPTKVRIANLELKCGDGRPDACGDQFGASDNSGSELGPSMTLTVFSFGSYAGMFIGNGYIATQDRQISCCSPFFLQYEVTGDFCYGAGASTVSSVTTLRITITG
jgi:hypothetical protein